MGTKTVEKECFNSPEELIDFADKVDIEELIALAKKDDPSIEGEFLRDLIEGLKDIKHGRVTRVK